MKTTARKTLVTGLLAVAALAVPLAVLAQSAGGTDKAEAAAPADKAKTEAERRPSAAPRPRARPRPTAARPPRRRRRKGRRGSQASPRLIAAPLQASDARLVRASAFSRCPVAGIRPGRPGRHAWAIGRQPLNCGFPGAQGYDPLIFVTGGVVSSLGKGIAAASLAAILEARGLRSR
jgi:hypothetical protein